jgi:putative sterol carrier protein
LRPRRYRDLLDALPGIGTNLLADRLVSLTGAGIVRQLDRERRTAGYALTERGERLRELVLAMARFGLGLLADEPDRFHGSVQRASWAALAIEAMADEAQAVADETYEFEIADEVFHVTVDKGHVTTRSGPAEDAVLRVRTDTATFFDLGSRDLDPIEAVVTGAVSVEGSVAAVPRCLRLIGLAADVPQRGFSPQR